MSKAKKQWLDDCKEHLVQATGSAYCAGCKELAQSINSILTELDKMEFLGYTCKNARGAWKNEEVKTMTIYGRAITNDDMANIADYMRDDIREELHAQLAPCSNEQFLRAYLDRDPDFIDLLRREFDFAE